MFLQEEAALLIARTRPELFEETGTRLPVTRRNELASVISGEKLREAFIFEKTGFLSGLFSDIPEDALIALAGSMLFYSGTDKVQYKKGEDYIVWKIKSGEVHSKTYISEDAEKEIPGLQDDTHNPDLYILSLGDLEKFNVLFPEYSYEIYRYLDN